jgi:TM2 domain-containing membrane protein YozV
MPDAPQRTAPPEYSLWAGFLSYLIPGLGQIYQGRVVKGVLFLVALNGLFSYGMALGSWKNVYLPDVPRANNPWKLPTVLINLYNRVQFAGQFWIGAAAWPAVWQYWTYDEKQNGGGLFGDFERTPSEEVLNKLQQDGDKAWDLGWVYTVIAGVLNILVIYDAAAGPALAEGEALAPSRTEEAETA